MVFTLCVTLLLLKESIGVIHLIVTLVNLVELNMLEFDFILGIDWLHVCFASIDCRTRVVKFQFPSKLILE